MSCKAVKCVLEKILNYHTKQYTNKEIDRNIPCHNKQSKKVKWRLKKANKNEMGTLSRDGGSTTFSIFQLYSLKFIDGSGMLQNTHQSKVCNCISIKRSPSRITESHTHGFYCIKTHWTWNILENSNTAPKIVGECKK